MSEFDFDKEFADDLRKERLFEPTNTGWNKVAADLDALESRRRRRRRFALWAWPIAASAAFVFFGLALLHAYNQVGMMQDEIARLKAGATEKSNIVLTDTTIRHLAVIRYDTIYRTVVMYRAVPDRSDQRNTQPAVPQSTAAITVGVALQGDTIHQENSMPKRQGADSKIRYAGADSIRINQAEQAGITAQPDAAMLHNPPAISDKQSDMAVLPSLLPEQIDNPSARADYHLPDMGLLLIPAPAERRRDKIIRRFRPHNAMVGVMAGIVFQQTQRAAPVNTYLAGVSGELAFGQHIRLRGSAAYLPTSFRVTPSGQAELDIPVVAPPTPNDQLHHIRIEQPLWDFSLGLQYVFVPGKRLRPYVSVAWVGEKIQKQKLQYEFTNQITEEEVYIRAPRAGSRFYSKELQVGLGADWAFAKRLSFRLEGMYQRQFSTDAPLLPDRWGITGGVVYAL